MTTSPLIRAALIVSDLDRSVAFYTDVIGLEETFFEGTLDHPAAAQLIGMPPESNIRARILKVPGPAFGMVGLFESTDPAPPELKRPNKGVNLGELCMVFYVSDLDPVVARLEAGGHDIVCPPVFLQVGERGGQREMTFRDPDGAMINMIERDPNAVFETA